MYISLLRINILVMSDVMIQQCPRHQNKQYSQPATSTCSNQAGGSAPKSLQKTWCQLKSAAENIKPKKVRYSYFLKMLAY